MAAVDVSIIIVSFNTVDLLRQCIQSVYAHTQQTRFEIIVVDNASADSSAEMVAAEFPEVKLIALKENLGFGRGNNVGMEQAEGEYIFYLNPDAELMNDAIGILLDQLRADPNIGMIGPRLYLDKDMRHHPTIRTFTSPNNIIPRYLPGYKALLNLRERYLIRKSQAQSVDWLVGAALLGSTARLRELGGFDEVFFVYSEEEDLCRRMQQRGWSIRYCPAASIVHYGGASSKQTPGLSTRFFWESQLLYLKRYYSSQEVAHFIRRFSFVLRLKAAITRQQAQKEYLSQIRTVINEQMPPR